MKNIAAESINAYRRPNLKRFIVSDASDMDTAIHTREFSGRMTKARWKLIDRYCRTMTWITRCHHDWDCCGCNFAQSVGFTYEFNLVRITVYNEFNY